MSNEIRVQASLQIRNGNLVYQSQPSAAVVNQSAAVGPTPGSLLIGLNRTLVDLSQLPSLGWCFLCNTDPTSTVEWGIYNSHYNEFFPVGELEPGEIIVIRLSRYLGQDLTAGTGTGLADAYVNHLALKAVGAPAYVRVEAFAN